ncbi:GNAT family N-acetyltransferase [Sporolactobacillus shoreicorticis]|uniref:GNAT family N-acetyltransferase n=1 Tax=Sporolactobacillus shoreicorticis TaxID=1923877 RepID=A0ABW5RZK2_9BACL|nr:GNAT family protein [Sporolactobacillus shoreicorticis]MCO7127209.1 GNAT family N-acetyltransferase [Sporolactobacillus shoreicorticis]
MFIHKVDNELELKLIDLRDAKKIFELSEQSRNYLREWLPWLDVTRTVGDTRTFIQGAQRDYGENRGMTMVILCDRVAVGVIGLNMINSMNKTAQIGYWLGAGHQGHGIMTRAARALTDIAFQELSLHKVEIRAAVGNTKSRAVPERLGFKQEGCIRQAEWLYDRYVDHIVYGMLDSEWTEKKNETKDARGAIDDGE